MCLPSLATSPLPLKSEMWNFTGILPPLLSVPYTLGLIPSCLSRHPTSLSVSSRLWKLRVVSSPAHWSSPPGRSIRPSSPPKWNSSSIHCSPSHVANFPSGTFLTFYECGSMKLKPKMLWFPSWLLVLWYHCMLPQVDVLPRRQ